VALLGLPYGDQALFVRREVLDEIGGLPDTPVMEDLDLVRAMRLRGRLVFLQDLATTSARRHRAYGVIRTAVRHTLAASAWGLGLDRARIAAWLGR
jgi:GT2 family glycosyltransferase